MHIAAQIMDDQRRQLNVAPPGDPIPLPPVEEADDAAEATTSSANRTKDSDPKQQRLQQDYSRVGASMKKIQQKASAVNNEAVQQMRPLK